MALIYRRLALLSGAKAEIIPLAREWSVLIRGYIGHNERRESEVFHTLKEARLRRYQVNSSPDHTAFVMSIDEILFPLTFTPARYDTELHTALPTAPPPNRELEPYTHAKDLYDLPRLRARNRIPSR